MALCISLDYMYKYKATKSLLNRSELHPLQQHCQSQIHPVNTFLPLTLTKLNLPSRFQIICSHRCFCHFQVVLIRLVYVQVFRFCCILITS